ncbi:MAG: hypothetical protein V9G25_07965 [Acidimicrobiia bacterium]
MMQVIPRDALIDHFFKTSAISAKVDSRHESIFGIAPYMLDVFPEMCRPRVALVGSLAVTLRIMMKSYNLEISVL